MHARSLTGLLTLLAAGSLAAQAAKAKAPGAISGRLTDQIDQSGRYPFSDAVEFAARVGEKAVECELTMAKPIAEGMFLCAHLFIDTDDSQNTGVNGDDLWVRATVGSRYRPNAHPSRAGGTMLDDKRASCSVPVRNEDRSVDWLHQNELLPTPRIEGSKIAFEFPLEFVKKRNENYTSIFSIRVRVETSCSDQPLDLAHTCNDEGLPIQVDGVQQPGEWSGQVRNDPGDELHPVARRMDVESFRLDHGPEALFASVVLAQPGFAERIGETDIRDESTLTFYVDPLFPRYQDAAMVRVKVGLPKRDGRLPGGGN